MPFYEYACGKCGGFLVWRQVADRNLPTSCPVCHAKAARVVTAPNLSLIPGVHRDAFARNEKSRHEPGVSVRHRCGTGCGCGTAKTAGPNKSTRTVDLGKTGKFETSRKRKRPWMLGH